MYYFIINLKNDENTKKNNHRFYDLNSIIKNPQANFLNTLSENQMLPNNFSKILNKQIELNNIEVNLVEIIKYFIKEGKKIDLNLFMNNLFLLKNSAILVIL